MNNLFIETIESNIPDIRNRSFHSLCHNISTDILLEYCNELELFRKTTPNLYKKVRASIFLYAIYRFYLQDAPAFNHAGQIPYSIHLDINERRFEHALEQLNKIKDLNSSIFSALAVAYHQITFDTLTNQVKQSVRSTKGNQWMFRVGHYLDHSIRINSKLLNRETAQSLFPILEEQTSVRLDLTHSCWSDIFFLGMDFPEAARVINISVDLGVNGRDKIIKPPIRACVRIINEPLIRLSSLDLNTTKDVKDLNGLFNFGNDYLSLLKAGIISSGLIPSSFEGTSHSLPKILEQIVGQNMGIELITEVNDIPKGSRLAVSTNLLGSIIAVLMRATNQTENLEGSLNEQERRIVASRAILGEWLGGSGGGWQDSGGIWPGIKSINGTSAKIGDPEFEISRGSLLPIHHHLDNSYLHQDIADKLSKSIVLVHGGMAQNVGPLLEMVTEKYLLRYSDEWNGRLHAMEIYDQILIALKEGNIKKLGKLTMQNWEGPLKTVIPGVSNKFTETIINKSKAYLKSDFWGFLMLGGMSGGGMAMFCNPKRQIEFKAELQKIMIRTKQELETSLTFAIDPVVYNFKINEYGTQAVLLSNNDALMGNKYYKLQIPNIIEKNTPSVSSLRKIEFDLYISQSNRHKNDSELLKTITGTLFHKNHSTIKTDNNNWSRESELIKKNNGFDEVQHEHLRKDLIHGRIGLALNRLPADTIIQDIDNSKITFLNDYKLQQANPISLSENKVAVMTLAAGIGSRWTQGAGVIKALSPFIQMSGKHRNFLDIHLAKTRKTSKKHNIIIPHIVTSSYLTDDPIRNYLSNLKLNQPIYISNGQSINQRLVPTTRDLHFLWEELQQEKLDEQKQKVRNMVQHALMNWARNKGEGTDYIDNIPLQRFNPPGHWYEIPNLLKNGKLAKIINEHKNIKTIMLHNLDTLGVTVDPYALDFHLQNKNVLTFEVVTRCINDRGGGLANINGKEQILESLAIPSEEDEFKMKYYNSMTTWVQINPLLEYFGLTRNDLKGPVERINSAIRNRAKEIPTYATVKDVKYRWGNGQEDIYPVMQFEKLWSDMTSQPDLKCGYLAVPRIRGQQLKDISELDEWMLDGSYSYVENLCDF
jgi:UDP-N-acetylglucosamine pyrophosphorylase